MQTMTARKSRCTASREFVNIELVANMSNAFIDNTQHYMQNTHYFRQSNLKITWAF